MADKKVYFFKMVLCGKGSSKELDYHYVPSCIQEMIDTHAKSYLDKDGKTHLSVDITTAGSVLHTTLDVFRYKNDCLFVRTTRQRPTNIMVAREYATSKVESLLPGTNEKSNGIEAYTYMYVDYQTGILSVVAAQSAPGEESIRYMFDKYSKKYSLDLIPIPNPDGIGHIYGKKNVEISSMDICIPVPDPAILENILGVKGRKLFDETTGGNIQATIQISSTLKRGKISTNTEDSNNLLDCIKENLSFFSKAKVNAKYQGMKCKPYNFYEEDFYFPISISTSKKINGEQVYYNADELINIYNEKMVEAFSNSRGYVTMAANRSENERID